MAPLKVIHVITRLDQGGSAQNTMLTVLGHDRRRYAPMVVAGEPGDRGAAQVVDGARRVAVDGGRFTHAGREIANSRQRSAVSSGAEG